MVAQQQRRAAGHRQADQPQDQPAAAPPLGPVQPVQLRDQKTGQNNAGAIAADHQSGGLPALLTAEPAGNQRHHRDVGKTTPHPHQRIEKDYREEVAAGTDTEHAEAEQQQSGCNCGARPQPAHHRRRQYNRQQVTDEIGGADKADPVVRELESSLHPRNQHRIGIAGQSETGEEHQRADGDDDPAVVEAGRERCFSVGFVGHNIGSVPGKNWVNIYHRR